LWISAIVATGFYSKMCTWIYSLDLGKFDQINPKDKASL
jgi:hypothetical protein